MRDISGDGGEEHRVVITPREHSFLRVAEMEGPYKIFLAPMLKDKGLTEESEVGVLMCGTPPKEADQSIRTPPWTVFVNADWLRLHLAGERVGHGVALQIPVEQIYGQVPGWPDTFFELLEAMVQTNTTFVWVRLDGYLALVNAAES